VEEKAGKLHHKKYKKAEIGPIGTFQLQITKEKTMINKIPLNPKAGPFHVNSIQKIQKITQNRPVKGLES
jgi:hypothetical protein